MKIYVAVPNQGTIHKHLVFALLCFERIGGHELTFNFKSEKPIENNRNKMVKSFLETDCEVMFWIDDDNPPAGASERAKEILDLVNLDCDILAIPTPIWAQPLLDGTGKFPLIVNCFNKQGTGWTEAHPMTGLQKVDACGSGCMFVKRRVFDHPEMAGPFRRTWDTDGIVVVGSDIWFCERAAKLGFQTWAHYDFACHHFKSRDLNEVYTLMKQRDVGAVNRPNPNTAEYWNEQWVKREERDYPQYPIICDLVAAKANGSPVRVVDIGCGRGDLLAQLSERENVRAEGWDISSAAVEICRGRGLKAVVSPISDMDIDGPAPLVADVIVMTEVLEHIDDDRGAIASALRRCSTLVYTVPNDCLPPGLEPEHRRVYTAKYVEDITPDLQEIQDLGDYLLVIAGEPIPEETRSD